MASLPNLSALTLATEAPKRDRDGPIRADVWYSGATNGRAVDDDIVELIASGVLQTK